MERSGLSINALRNKYKEDVIIVEKGRLTAIPDNSDNKLFFHPNLAMIRAKRMLRNETDPFIETAQLKEGMSMLDCTLGLASDSIIASLAVGSAGSVSGIEGSSLIYLLAKEGLATFSSGIQRFDQAMRRINVIKAEHYAYLRNAGTNSVDVVYFDPMFSTEINTSDGINSIRTRTVKNTLNINVIEEASRVARERIVLKDHWKSERFNELGFVQYKRKTALFHYGVLEV